MKTYCAIVLTWYDPINCTTLLLPSSCFAFQLISCNFKSYKYIYFFYNTSFLIQTIFNWLIRILLIWSFFEFLLTNFIIILKQQYLRNTIILLLYYIHVTQQFLQLTCRTSTPQHQLGAQQLSFALGPPGGWPLLFIFWTFTLSLIISLYTKFLDHQYIFHS